MNTAVAGCTSILIIVQAALAQDWAVAAALETPRAHAAAAVDGNGRVYILGGRIDWCTVPAEDTATVERFANGAWEYVASLPEARINHCAVGIGNYVYVMGGNLRVRDAYVAVASCLRYDAGQDAWEEMPALNVSRTAAGAAHDGHGRIYVVGGNDVNDQPLASVEVFDVSRPSVGWTLFDAELQDARSYSAVTFDRKGRLYAIGGSQPLIHLTSVERVDVTDPSGEWQYVASMPGTAYGRGVALGHDGRIYVAGGWSPGFTDEVHRYDVDLDVWQSGPPLAQLKTGLSLAVLPNGLIFAIGGATSGCPEALNTVEILNSGAVCSSDLVSSSTFQPPPDGVVDAADLAWLLGSWGECP